MFAKTIILSALVALAAAAPMSAKIGTVQVGEEFAETKARQ